MAGLLLSGFDGVATSDAVADRPEEGDWRTAETAVIWRTFISNFEYLDRSAEKGWNYTGISDWVKTRMAPSLPQRG